MHRRDSNGRAHKDVLKREFLADILAGRRMPAMERIMAAFRKGYAIPDIYMEIFQEALYEVGRLWETNQIGVAEEHVATAIVQFIMLHLYEHLEMPEVKRGRLVITGVRGELHQVGANMVSDILESEGWDLMFLGTDVPTASVIEAIHEHQADLLGISATLSMNVPAVIELIETVRREFGAGAPRIVLGGGAFSRTAQPPPELEGCILALDLRNALELLRAISVAWR